MKVIEASETNFKEEIKEGKVLVDFNATWCGPCRMLKPILDEFSENTKVKVLSVDVDQNENLAREYNIYSIPCLIIFENGVEVKRNIGLLSIDDLKDFVGE
jgi:thioredoxin 1